MCDRTVEQFDAEEVTIIALSLSNIPPRSQNIRRMAKPVKYLRFVFVDEQWSTPMEGGYKQPLSDSQYESCASPSSIPYLFLWTQVQDLT